ncbi:MAG: hypothetical protein IKP50_00210 [Bacilli bacterium]|nr:hypothetical protein [Bacilli bacterium]
MGMTIDKTIEFFNGLECHTPQAKDARDVAVDTMRKYQKIEQIAFPLQFCTTDKLEHEAIMKICEVLEDGNDGRQ